MERLNDIMGRAMQRRPAPSDPSGHAARPASYSYNTQRRASSHEQSVSRSLEPGTQHPQQGAPHPSQRIPEQTGRAGYAGRANYSDHATQSGRIESSERLGRVPAVQPSRRPPGEHSIDRPATAPNIHPNYTRPVAQARAEYSGGTPRAYQTERQAPARQNESYHPLNTRPVVVQHYAEDYTVSPRARADAIDSWEDDDRATTIQYGDWEEDEQEIVVYQRAATAYYEEERFPAQQKLSAYPDYPQHPLVTRNLREVQMPEVTMPPAPRPDMRSAGELHHRMTQPLDPRVVRNVGNVERTEATYSDASASYRATNELEPSPQRAQPAYLVQRRPIRAPGQSTSQPKEPVRYAGPTPPTIAAPVNTPAPTVQGTKQVCLKCRGAGYLRADVPFGHPNFGKPIACECKEIERKEKRRQQLRDMSNMDAFRDSNFRTFNPRVPGVQEAYQVAREFSQDPDGWLLLIGPNGCGKTHLAAAIANQSLDSGSVVLFAVVPDLLDHLRAAFAPTAKEVYDQLFSKMREAELLVLDDLGSQQSSPWANEKLFQLLNYRYNMGMPTVITANPKGLQGVDERIRSRLTDISLVTTVVMEKARDYRPNHPKHNG